MLSYLMAPDIISELSSHRADIKSLKIEEQNAKYDTEVTEVLSQYWPQLENLQNIKRGDNRVYTAQIAGSDVIVKSTHHTDDLERDWKQ